MELIFPVLHEFSKIFARAQARVFVCLFVCTCMHVCVCVRACMYVRACMCVCARARDFVSSPYCVWLFTNARVRSLVRQSILMRVLE